MTCRANISPTRAAGCARVWPARWRNTAMSEPPVDLSSLHLSRDPERLHRMRATILAGVEPSLAARRATHADHSVNGWRRWLLPLLPMYALSAAILIASLASLAVRARATRAVRQRDAVASMAMSLGLPRSFAAWVV